MPKPYKRNTIIGDLHRLKRIAMNFRDEVKHSKEKFVKANYLLLFAMSITFSFNLQWMQKICLLSLQACLMKVNL